MVEEGKSGELPATVSAGTSKGRAIENPVGKKGPVASSKIYERLHLDPEHARDHAAMLFNQRSQLPPSDFHIMQIGVEKSDLATQHSGKRAKRFAPSRKHGDPEIEGGGGPAL